MLHAIILQYALLEFTYLTYFFASCQLFNETHKIADINHYEITQLQLSDPTLKLTKAKELCSFITKGLSFNAYGISFDLVVKEENDDLPDATLEILTESLTIEMSAEKDEVVDFDGYMKNSRDSDMFGNCADGQLNGMVHHLGEDYFFESASKYFKNISNPFTLVVYRSSEYHHFFKGKTNNQNIKELTENITQDDRTTKRQARYQYKNKICHVEAVSDVEFFAFHKRNRKKTIATMKFAIRYTNRVYKKMDFDFNGQPDGLQVIIIKVTIFETTRHKEYTWNVPTPYSLSTFFPKIQERATGNKFCASVYFTDRGFKKGEVGMAPLGMTHPHVSYGLCATTSTMNGGKVIQGNAAICTIRTPWESVMTNVHLGTCIAHELGHATGSPHDPVNHECNPGGVNGNFIMNPMLVQGGKRNNVQFSPCSRRKMHEYLTAKGKCLRKNVRKCVGECDNTSVDRGKGKTGGQEEEQTDGQEEEQTGEQEEEQPTSAGNSLWSAYRKKSLRENAVWNFPSTPSPHLTIIIIVYIFRFSIVLYLV